ncbi:MAG: Tripartite tricarboxylate transporter TctA family protein [Syntrophaceae bacterium PtaU1.Bin231]|nr:MAG: Tripartite tricarboxylate transporter TctA family protein [Syntrophaceae bacterium PtaU1.Bin231]HOG15739.1 tripartite tricarboxylate transporter permease [Syntrophales bacterium]
MIENLQSLLLGFQTALSVGNLFICMVGIIVGTLVGALPGIGPTGAVAILLPASYSLGPAGALILLAGIYYGTQYGGTITSVLMRVPGESASVVTTFDGYEMAKQGRAGVALGIAAIGSFIGGTLSIVGLMFLGPVLADYALAFGPAEYFGLMVLALSLITAFTGKSMVRGLIATIFGLLLGTVGDDVISGDPRLTFGSAGLLDGIQFLPVAVGLFGVSEMIESVLQKGGMEILRTEFGFRKVLPSVADFVKSIGAILRGTVLGFFTGILPGAGATIASFLSYGVEQKVSRTPERFGKGAIEGVAGPETANNASTGGAFIPMLSLGIPGSGTTAVLLGAFLMFGLQPGPALFREAPDVVWGLIASMYIGNVALLVINVGFIPLIVRLMDVIKPYMRLVVMILAIVGVYSFRNTVLDVVVMLLFAVIGYFMKKYDFPQAPVVLGLILGDRAEQSLRQALSISNNDPSILFHTPLSAVLLIAAAASFLLPLLSRAWKRKKETTPA